MQILSQRAWVTCKGGVQYSGCYLWTRTRRWRTHVGHLKEWDELETSVLSERIDFNIFFFFFEKLQASLTGGCCTLTPRLKYLSTKYYSWGGDVRDVCYNSNWIQVVWCETLSKSDTGGADKLIQSKERQGRESVGNLSSLHFSVLSITASVCLLQPSIKLLKRAA